MAETTVNTTIRGGTQTGIVGAKTVNAGPITIINNYNDRSVSDPENVAAAVSLCPYPGLSYFSPDEADVFFGRETTIQRLAEAVRRQSFTALVGASGSGKSSVVLAGLAPFLNRMGGWQFSYFRIGTELDRDPYLALARGLAPLYGASSDETERLVNTRKLAGHLKSGNLNLADVFGDVRSRSKGSRILLIADQFEEFFTVIADEAQRRQFVDMLFAPFQVPLQGVKPDICLMITLRADFFGRTLHYRPLSDLLQDHVENLGPMTRRELEAAIVRPAAKREASFEPGLVETLLDRVEHEPGGLPLLQFALRELWKHQTRHQLTRRAYDEIGGVEGALTQRAEEIFTSEIDRKPSVEPVFRRLFTRLVAPGDGQADTRRVVERAELGDLAWTLAQRLADEENRLVVMSTAAGRETAELTHEALIGHWPRLAGWLARDRAFRSWLHQIKGGVERWSADPSDDGPLLRGGMLAQAADWFARRAPELSAQEADYVRASVALQQAEKAREEAARQQEIIHQQELLEASEQARVQAEQRAKVEERARRQSISRQLSASALNKLTSDYSAALLMAMEATTFDDTVDARSTLYDVICRHPSIGAFLRPPVPGRYFGAPLPRNPGAAFTPDGQIAAAVTNIGAPAVELWAVDTRRPLGRRLVDHDEGITALCFSEDGRLLATAAADGIIIYDMSRLELVARLPINEPGMHLMAECVAFSVEGDRVAVGTNDGSDGAALIRIWETQTLRSVTTLAVNGRPRYSNTGFGISRLLFLPGAQSLVVGVQPFLGWRVGRRLLIPTPPAGGADPDEQLPPFRPPDPGYVVFLDIATGQPTMGPWEGCPIAISRSGDKVFVRNDKDEIVLIYTSPEASHILAPLRADRGLGAFSPDGQTLGLIAGAGLQLLDFNGGEFYEATHPDPACHFSSLAVSPDGRCLLTLDSNDAVILWNMRERRSTGRLWASLPDGAYYSPLTQLAISDGGQFVATTGSPAEQLMVWSTDTAVPVALATPPWHGRSIERIAFRPGLSIPKVLLLLSDGVVAAFNSAQTGSPFVPLIEGASGLAVAHRADRWAIGRASGDIEIFDGPDPVRPKFMHLPREVSIQSLALDSEGRRLAVAGHDGFVRIWDIDSSTQLAVLAVPAAFPCDDSCSLLFSTNGSKLLGFATNQAVLWDTSTGVTIGSFASVDQMMGRPMIGAFSPQDDLFALAHPYDRGIRLIRSDLIESYGPQLLMYKDGSSISPTCGVTFTPDGTQLITAHMNGDLVKWDFSLEQWRRQARSVANRDFTHAEWERFIPSEPYRDSRATKDPDPPPGA